MEQKTKVHAEDGKQELTIIRKFELPVELLFRAYMEPELVEQWMGTKVLKLENQQHGSYQFETTSPKGDRLRFNGTIHKVEQNQHIVRTFEFEGMPFGVQLEILRFEAIDDETSSLVMHIIYESVEKRDQQLKLPFAYGINMAHDRIEVIMNKSKH